MKQVDTNKYIDMLRGLTEQGKEVRLPVRGNSMSPFLIGGRDEICFRRPEKTLRRGDIVLFQRANGEYILHRICCVRDGAYFVAGDAQTKTEGPIAREQIFGVVTKVCRKGKWIAENDFLWRCFARMWTLFLPLRRTLLRMYTEARRKE